jgi:aminopeptidase YwaD
MKHCFLLIFTLYTLTYAQIPFAADSALAYLKTISVDIGPRPMGSPNERRAIEFALAKFHEFGLDKVYCMNMEVASDETAGSLTNTSSGIAVGVLQGNTNRIIVIGGHIDSESPFVQGANDDGSGSAAVIELARVLSKEHFRSTIVFCLFGGEESGLCGSKYFVDNFPQIDNVSLMLEVDMANGSDPLIPSIDCQSGNAPIWLVQATYEEFNKLGYSGLQYPTHFSTAMAMMPGGGAVGSDHQPFLEKGIPAIAFTSNLDDPIHTPQDDFEHFKPNGLKRSGDLIYTLVHRFDKNLPEEKTNSYYLLQIGKRAIFFPLQLLSAFIITSIIFAIGALVFVRKRRIEIDKSHRPKLPALKLFFLALIIQTCVWLSENLIGLVKGLRFAWITHPEAYFILGFFAALVGIVISLILAPRMNLSRDPYRWQLRAVCFLLVFISLMALINVKAAFYPAIALFFITLAVLVQKPWLKLLFWIISPHFMFRLMFSEGFILLGREITHHSFRPLSTYFALHTFYIIFFALWSFPFLLSFAAIYFDSGINFFWLKKWKTQIGIIIIIAAFLCCAIVLVFTPSYSDEWRPAIYFDQIVNIKTGEGEMRLKSSEYLRGITVHLPERDTVISTWARDAVIKKNKYENVTWINLNRTVSTSGDSSTIFDISLKPRFKHPPQSFIITYSSSKKDLEVITGKYITRNTGGSISFKWNSAPDTTLMIPVRFRTTKDDTLTEIIEARFIELIEPIRIEKGTDNIFPQTILRRTEVIKH